MQVAEFFCINTNDLGIVEFQELVEGLEVDVICGIDGLGGAEDGVGDGDAAAEEGAVLDVVDEEGGRVKHADDAGDNLEGLRGHLEPGVEGRDEVFPDILARVVHHVVEGSQEDLLLLGGPVLWPRWVIVGGIAGRRRWV